MGPGTALRFAQLVRGSVVKEKRSLSAKKKPRREAGAKVIR
jgi:hypothetical protein